MVATQGETLSAVRRRLPGEPGIWVFVLLDMSIFAQMFGIFAWYRGVNCDVFRSSQDFVNPVYGLIYTLVLLTSSWCVVMAVSAARRNQVALASRLALAGIGLGMVFAVVKVIEYGGKFSAGITPLTNDFFMFYFVMTFVHLLHAVVGIGVLAYLRRQITGLTRLPADRRRIRMIETSAVYWHMVDLLWIVLFALFYLRG